MKRRVLVPLLLAGLTAAALPAQAGAKMKVLFDLRNRDGGYNYGTPVFDSSGNLYATGTSGGKYGGGTLYELSPSKSGKWSIQVLHDFANPGDLLHPQDGTAPTGPLTFDASGNLYGTTLGGGIYNNPDTGGGIAYRLSPGKNGAWRETVLHDFGSTADGGGPMSGVIMDANGNLYGTTSLGGSYSGNCAGIGCGSVFELSPDGKGGWTEAILYAFTGGTDGNTPYSGLVADASGNLYGTTMFGGVSASGNVFELSPGQNGQWTETVLYSFCTQTNCTDGAVPFDRLTFDVPGNLYGTTDGGGTATDCQGSCGTVFELSPANGGWTETVIHSLVNKEGDGPTAGVVFDAAGNLYGTSVYGGSSACNMMGCGTVFELSPGQNGTWTETTLHQFQNGRDGANPPGGLVVGPAGAVYGANTGHGTGCGEFGCGAVYSIQP